jgi:hypothetical protein
MVKPLTPLVGELGEVIDAVPETKLQIPVPTRGVLALIVAVVAQMVCDTGLVITAVLGILFTKMATVEVDGALHPLTMVHCKMVVQLMLANLVM